MKCIRSRLGYTTVSIDLAAGEPTVTGHYSQDANYLYATFEGVGKAPFYKNGILMIDDIYLQTMSVSPMGQEIIRKGFDSGVYEGVSFVEAWLKDPEIIKKAFKGERNFHKMLCLALGYGMRPKKMVEQSYDAGRILELPTARRFHGAYWELYSGVHALSNRLGYRMKRDGYIVNPFGYRLKCPEFKALNYFIQSSVSGIMHVFCMKLFAIAPYAKFITVIHDEVLADVPDERLEDFRRHKELATDSLNDDLRWTTKIRTGFATGKNWYEAK